MENIFIPSQAPLRLCLRHWGWKIYSFRHKHRFANACAIGGSSGKITESKQEIILLYPNAAADYLYIKNPTVHSYSIFDLSGKLLFESEQKASPSEIEINIKSLQPGLYFISMMTDKGLTSERFVKE